jgi:sigma-B regulation protein RsbU (phosphoserine phosphatase)
MAGARLEIIGVPGQHPLPADGADFTIGRLKTNHLSVLSSEVSRVHAAIRTDEAGRFTLRDCNSRFGTFLNDTQIEERLLTDGDRIRLGREGGPELLFLLREERAPGDTTTRTIGEFRQIAALLEGLRALGSGRVLEEVLTLVLDSAIDVAGAQRGFVMLADEKGQLEFTLARGRGKTTLPGRDFAASRKIPHDVFRTGVTQIARNLEGEPDHARTAIIGIRTVICVPLRVVRFADAASDPDSEQRRIGVLYLDSREESAFVSSWVGSTVETLATEAAVAIESARLYRQSLENARLEQEMRIAAEIQQALLPKRVPAGRHFVASAASVPTRSIGGDFFDYLELPDGQVGFVLGDVAGKGPPAALLSALMQGMFAFAAEGSRGPADTIARLNLALFRRGFESRFVTLFAGVLAADGMLTYCNAGHNPPLLFGRDRVRRLDVGGPVVGLLESVTFDEEAVRLAHGESVVVFSDGISEAENAVGEEYGDERILAAVQRSAASPPSEIVEQLFADVRQFCGRLPQTDDMTALVIRYE